MKRQFCLLALVLFIAGLAANPVQECVLSEIWFTPQGHCMMELYDYWGVLDAQVCDLEFHNGDYIATTECDSLINHIRPLVIDATELMPDLNLNPEGDTLMIYGPILPDFNFILDYLVWGNGTYVNLTPPLPGQSMVQWLEGYDDWHSFYWCKEANPTPGTSPFVPQSKGVLRLVCHNQTVPLPNLPVYYLDSMTVNGITDANGVWEDSLYACNFYWTVRNPATNQSLCSGTAHLEPNQVIVADITLNLTGTEEDIQTAQDKPLVRFCPQPFTTGASALLHIELGEGCPKAARHQLRIYNTKGEFVTELVIPRSGRLAWAPGATCGSGVYVYRLIGDSRIIACGSFTLLK